MILNTTRARIQRVFEVGSVDQGSQEDQVIDHQKTLALEAQDLTKMDPRYRRATVVVYASDWVISGSLVQEYDEIYYPVMFASRTLTSNELNYGIAEKETLEITKCVKGEDEILGALAVSITPRSEVDKALILIAPKKELRRKIQAPILTIGRDQDLYAVSFDGSARVKRGGGAYSAILRKLPEEGLDLATPLLIVNEAEYHGLLLCLDQLEDLDPRRLEIYRDWNLVICKCEGSGSTRTWPDHELLHVKRDWNGSADSLASAALQRQCGIKVESEKEIQDLVTFNRLDEILVVKMEDKAAQISAVTTRSNAKSGVRAGSGPDSLPEEVGTEQRIERIRQKYLGEIRDLTQEDAKVFGSIVMNYEVNQLELRFYCPTTMEAAADRDKLMRLVGDHQGIGRLCDRIRDHFHWRGLYKSLKRYVGECVDCERGKGRPRIQGESPGNLHATYPFQVIAMDHIPSLPRSFNGNTELLIFEDLFSGFGASEVIRHDREPGYMSDLFKSFNKILSQRQRATMAYGPKLMDPQSTTTRALKMYVQDLDQRDWDEYAERLTFAINTARGRIRGETPFYMIRGWDSRSTLEAVIPVGSTRRHDRDPRMWRYQMQKHYQQAREQVNQRLREAIADRADTHNDLVRPHPVEAGSRVWLYLDRVREGCAKKLAHLWHRSFRVAEKIGEYAVRLKIAGSTYSIFPVVHVLKIKPSSQMQIELTSMKPFYLKTVGSKIEPQMNMK
ncbi:LOW QUALITY PROTEIN: reverse transcriptase [Phytophthora megakarya]|uniref:Reverse transcriptase n=1 Tax=Phytophthora megakarya TaxID=4795 RepID=A0A225WX46_9STRA|nr:LOW QUALITY PROTEIN: reverse transcriptase [Phytophthora megakarya]